MSENILVAAYPYVYWQLDYVYCTYTNFHRFKVNSRAVCPGLAAYLFLVFREYPFVPFSALFSAPPNTYSFLSTFLPLLSVSFTFAFAFAFAFLSSNSTFFRRSLSMDDSYSSRLRLGTLPGDQLLVINSLACIYFKSCTPRDSIQYQRFCQETKLSRRQRISLQVDSTDVKIYFHLWLQFIVNHPSHFPAGVVIDAQQLMKSPLDAHRDSPVGS